MSLWKIAWRSIQQRSLSSLMTGLSMALGVALVVAVLVVLGVVKDSFTQNAEGYNIIVGPKGGSLELVLNTVYHLGRPQSTLPWSYYEEFTEGKFAPSVELAIPYCLGDNYEGYRVVATTSDLFDKSEYRAGQKYTFAAGHNFADEAFYEAVIGATVARNTGLRVGDTFEPTHGLSAGEMGHKHDPFRVVGVLDPTGTPNDRALFISVEGFFLLEGHSLDKPSDVGTSNDMAASAAADEHDDEHDHAHEDGHDHDAEHDHEHADDHDHDDHAHEGHDDEVHDEHEHDEAVETTAAPAAANSSTGEDAADEHREDEHDERDHAEDGHDHDEHAHDEHDDHDHDAHDHDAHDHDEHDHGHGHDHHHEPLPKELREVTAILVRTDLTGGLTIPKVLQRDPRAMAVYPVQEINTLFEGLVGNLKLLLVGLAVLVVVVAGVGIMVSIYNTMNDRRRDIAVMRALGAGRQTVMFVILFESLLLSLVGGVAGLLIGHGLVALLNPLIVAQTGVSIGFFQFQIVELALIPGLIVLATAAGIVPALAAYRTDVSKALGDAP
ncbi:MAG: ABC transporter permease [Planctomycetales bacterium]|nr:ABC transporter permease [Planctomycetales bacterium]